MKSSLSRRPIWRVFQGGAALAVEDVAGLGTQLSLRFFVEVGEDPEETGEVLRLPGPDRPVDAVGGVSVEAELLVRRQTAAGVSFLGLVEVDHAVALLRVRVGGVAYEVRKLGAAGRRKHPRSSS